ncbi:MAG: type IV secretion system protein [Rickettsiaceae bacterium]|nr:type IV secretion system protein [Rickettsiaceae bacterium]
MKNHWIIAILLFLSACSGERCIDADDFGHAVFNVSSRYSTEDLEGQIQDKQVAPWIETNYRLSGKPLAITVKGWDYNVEPNNDAELSAWCPWFGKPGEENILGGFCVRLKECEFENEDTCSQEADAPIVNAPCILKKGVGLYALIAKKGTDPNLSLETRKQPEGINFHVGAKTTEYNMYEIDRNGKTRQAGGRVYQYTSEEQRLDNINNKLYFKILDKFYDDNSGKYKVVIKSGIDNVDADPIFYITSLVKTFLFGDNNNQGISQRIYTGIINNDGYRYSVQALLTLYIIYTALIYLAGHIELTRTELITRIVKIAIVAALLNTEISWSFFNDYLFVYFVGVVEQILKIIFDIGATGPGAASIIGLLIAPQTLYKLLALLFTDWLGIVYIIVFLIIITVLLLIFFQATVIYLTALIAISLMLMMGPVFICFLLFDFTRSLFDNWLKQLISHAFQPIILFTGVIFISVMIRHEIYASLGFRICKYNILHMVGALGGSTVGDPLGSLSSSDLDLTGGGVSNLSDSSTLTTIANLRDSLFYWWFPEPMIGSNFSRELRMIPIPEAHFPNEDSPGFISGTGSSSNFCEPYGCIGERYVDLPFLDPQKDIRRINHFWNGNFVQIDGLIFIVIALYLLFKFNGLAVNVARFLTGTTNNTSNIQKVANQALSDMKGAFKVVSKKLNKAAIGATSIVGKGAGFARSQIDKSGSTNGIARGLSKTLGAVELTSKFTSNMLEQGVGNTAKAIFKEKTKNITPSAFLDRMRIRALKKEALSGKGSKAVLSEVRKKTGLTQDGLNPNAKKDYEKALAEKILPFVDKKLPQEKRMKVAQSTAKSLSDKKIGDIDKELGLMKYGKKFDKLSDSEKLEIKKLTSDRSLRKLSNDAAKAREFQKAYVEAYARLSEQGVGMIGKDVKAVRILEKARHNYKQMKEDDKKADLLLGKKILGVLDNNSYVPDRKQNPQLRTLGEIKALERQAFRDTQVERKIDRWNNREKTNVTNPEFIAWAEKNRPGRVALYKKLANEEAEIQLRREIINNKKIFGEAHLSSKATNGQSKQSIDELRKVEDSLIKSDRIIGREEEYKLRVEEASSVIREFVQKDKANNDKRTSPELKSSEARNNTSESNPKTNISAPQEKSETKESKAPSQDRVNLSKQEGSTPEIVENVRAPQSKLDANQKSKLNEGSQEAAIKSEKTNTSIPEARGTEASDTKNNNVPPNDKSRTDNNVKKEAPEATVPKEDNRTLDNMLSDINKEMANTKSNSPRYQELSKVKAAIETYEKNQIVLDQIEQRKEKIRTTIGAKINRINDYRKRAKLDEYEG